MCRNSSHFFKQQGGSSMITKKRILMAVQNEIQLNHARKFEGLQVIDKIDLDTIKKVWANNKTPVILTVTDDDVGRYKRITVFRLDAKYLTETYVFQKTNDSFCDKCREIGFEPGEYITGKKYNTAEERCILCELANLKGMNNDLAQYNRLVENEVDCIIYESENFYVTSELGSLVPGFLMIVPKRHILSVAQFPENILPEYKQVCEDVEYILKKAFGEKKVVSFFEHGSGPSGMSAHQKSIVHAHTHVVVGYPIQKKYLEMVQMKPVDDISVAAHTHYFSYQEGSNGQLLACYDPDVYVQRQFPRQVIAEQIGLAPGQYNWRNVAFSENIKASLYKIHTSLKLTANGRIYDRTRAFIQGYEKRDDFVKA